MKLKIKDNWGHLSYFLNSVELPLKGQVELVSGEVVDIINEYKEFEVPDMGNTYRGTTRVPKCVINFNNQKITVELTELDIKRIV